MQLLIYIVNTLSLSFRSQGPLLRAQDLESTHVHKYQEDNQDYTELYIEQAWRAVTKSS